MVAPWTPPPGSLLLKFVKFCVSLILVRSIFMLPPRNDPEPTPPARAPGKLVPTPTPDR
ncbi:MAG TPA: hypothetical protein VD866_25765 [Urbifossiella sp.]|nr:hypothetical protein [Urbifossiella sp.]